MGETIKLKSVYVKEEYSIKRPNSSEPSSTAAHEIGHILGMDDADTGIMSRSQDNNRTTNVNEENIKQMMNSTNGKKDIISRLFYGHGQ